MWITNIQPIRTKALRLIPALKLKFRNVLFFGGGGGFESGTLLYFIDYIYFALDLYLHYFIHCTAAT